VLVIRTAFISAGVSPLFPGYAGVGRLEFGFPLDLVRFLLVRDSSWSDWTPLRRILLFGSAKYSGWLVRLFLFLLRRRLRLPDRDAGLFLFVMRY